MTKYKTIIIEYKEPDTNSDVSISAKTDTINILGDFEGYIKKEWNVINGMSVKIPEESSDTFINTLKKDSRIKHVHEAVSTYAIGGAPGTEAGRPWGLKHIRAPDVWATGNKGAGIKVGVIDSGIDYNHPDLSPNYKGGYNFLNSTTNPMDDCGHGTHVAGTIAGINTGVAPEAYIYSLRVLSGTVGSASCSGNSGDIISAVDWCANNNIKIINISIGLNGSDSSLRNACDNAYNNNGILIVCAAGNSGPASTGYCGSNSIGEPASYDSCIAVTALSCGNNDLAIFNSQYGSSRGPKAEICAPGKYISSTWVTSVRNYATLQGTSMASPHVAGVAALVWKANPSLTNVQVRQRLQNGTIDLGVSGRDGCFGYGLIDAPSAVNGVPGPINPPTPTTETHKRYNSGTGGTCETVCGSGIDECSLGCYFATPNCLSTDTKAKLPAHQFVNIVMYEVDYIAKPQCFDEYPDSLNRYIIIPTLSDNNYSWGSWNRKGAQRLTNAFLQYMRDILAGLGYPETPDTTYCVGYGYTESSDPGWYKCYQYFLSKLTTTMYQELKKYNDSL